jgi:CheY-like chemotaxis protein
MPPKMRILYCDINYSFGKRFNEVARRLKYEPVFVTSVAEAWELIQTDHFDLIVSDHKPPQLNGLELLRLVKAHEATATVPFVLYTSNKDEDLPAEAATFRAVFEPQRTEDLWENLIPKWFLPSAA